MLTVKTPEEVSALLKTAFPFGAMDEETVPLLSSLGRVLARAVTATEAVPGFHRSTVDGYAVKASDTFGCSDAMPSLLELCGEVLMGKSTELELLPGQCAAIPTGGALPRGADAAVMIEYTEDYGDGTIGILRSAAPGENLIFRGDDVKEGQEVLSKGKKLSPKDIGALAAMGVDMVSVSREPRVAILSTGDELIPVSGTPLDGQIRDVNSAMLHALLQDAGAKPVPCGILKDDEDLLSRTLTEALQECDMALISGGSSVGTKDAAFRVLEANGDVLLHGIAMKPGKPTILGNVKGKPVFGLPGHPVAAFFVSELFVRPLIAQLMGRELQHRTITARLPEAVSANHGRSAYLGVILTRKEGELYARPIHGKSGLITTLSAADGYICIPRDTEGLAAGEQVQVYLFAKD